MTKYHINPNTGMPGRCTAQPGNCPYGGESEHYTTYSEAFETSQSTLNDSFELLPKKNLNELDRETKFALDDQEKEQEKMEKDMAKIKSDDSDFYKKRAEIRKIKDPEVLLGIIDGSLDTKRDWAIVGAALKNENLPKSYINNVIHDKLNVYNVNFTRRLMYNPNLNNEDLEYVIKNTKDDDTKLLAYMHPNLNKETILWHIDNEPDKVITYPYNGMLINQKHRTDSFIRKWTINLVTKGIDPGFPSSKLLYNKYQ